MTRTTAATLAACAVLLNSSSNAFLAPTAPRAARSVQSSTVMKAENNAGAKATAAVLAAGALLQGALVGPAIAQNYETAAAAPTTYLAGFGLPNPSSDPENNNAASGKVNGDKYDTKQNGAFAAKYSAGGNGADYGSAKGTDFGPTAGTNPDAASNTKGTAGAFREDAERPENQGKVNIANKNTRDAANLDVKSVAKDPNAVKGPNPLDAKNSVASAADSAKTAAKKATGGNLFDIFKSNNGNPSTKPSDPGAGFGFGVTPSDERKAQGPADVIKAEVKKNGGDNAKAGKGPESIGVTASNPADGLKKSISEGKNILASATGAVSEQGDNGGNAVTKAAQTAANKVSGINAGSVGDAAKNVAQAGKDNLPNVNAGSVGDAAKSVAQAGKDKLPNVGGVGDAAQSVAQAGKSKVGAEADAVKGLGNKVKDDVSNVAKNAPSGDAGSSGAGGFFSDPRGQQETVRQKTAGKVDNDVKTATGSSLNLSLGNLGNEADQAKNNPQGKIEKDLNTAKNKVKDDINTVAQNQPKAGGFFSDPRGQQEAVRQKTAGKVKDDVKTATGSNINLSLGNLGNEADQAKNNPQGKIEKDLNTAKNKVKDDINTVAQNQPKAGGFFSDPRGQQEAVRQKTAGKVKDDVKTATGSNINLSLGNLGGEADQAKNNPLGKVQKDLNTAKNKVTDGVNGQNAPKSGGWFNWNSGNVGKEANQAKNNPFGKAQKDFNTAKNKVSDDVSGVNLPKAGGLFGENSEKQAQTTGQKTVDKVSSDLNEAKKAVESARKEGFTTKFSS